MSQKSLTTALIFVLCSALIAFAYIARKPLCIDSKVVEKIDRVTVEVAAEAYRCGLGRHVSYDESLALKLPDLGRRLAQLERFFDDLSSIQQRVHISIYQGERDNFYKIQDHHILIGEKLVHQSDILERAILKIWLREKISASVLLLPTFENLFEDLFYFAAMGNRMQTKSRWPFALKNLKSYCRSTYMAPEHIATCSQLSSEDLQSDQEIVLHSLRPLLAESLLSGYSQLKADQKLQILRGVLKLSSEWKTNKKEIRVSSAKMHEQVYLAAQEIETVLENLSHWAEGNDNLRQLAQLFEQELSLRGYSQSGSSTYVDYLFIPQDGMEYTKEFIGGLSKTIEGHPQILTTVFSDDRLQFLPSQDWIDQKLFSNLRAHRAIITTCEVPNYSKLVALAQKAEKVLIVHQCLDVENLKFSGYLKSGVEGFAQENPQVSFVQLHMPSLLQAWKGEGENPIPLLMSQNWRSPVFQKLGWQSPRWDEKLKIYKPQSAIEAVEAFRLKPNNL